MSGAQPSVHRQWPAAHHETLPNGLRVVVTPLDHLHHASVVLTVRAGSRYESRANNGISHLVEHLLFRGCDAYPDASVFNAAVESLTDSLGAATGRHMTTLDALCMPDSVGALLALIGAMIEAPLLADIELERGIILEELRDEVDETGRDVDIHNVARMRLFDGCSLGFKVGGTRRVVEKLDRDACVDWHARHYVASNMVLSVAGAVDPATVFAAARRALGRLRSGTPARVPDVIRRTDLPAFEYVQETSSQVQLELAFVLPPASSPDWATLFRAEALLGDGTAARLGRRLVEELGLAYYVGVDWETYDGLSLLLLEASVSKERVLQLLDESLAVIDELRSQRPGDAEWTRSTARLELGRQLALDDAHTIAVRRSRSLLEPALGEAETFYDELLAVRPEAIPEVCSRHLVGETLQVTVVGDLPPIDRAAIRRRIHRLRA